jgi:hypothetical protein
MKICLTLAYAFLITFFCNYLLFSQNITNKEENQLLLHDLNSEKKWSATVYEGNDNLISLQTGVFPISHDSYFYSGEELKAQGLRFLVSKPTEFSILLTPPQPLAIGEFVTKIKLQIQGNNTGNKIYLIFKDAKGQFLEPVFVTQSNFSGWKLNEVNLFAFKNRVFTGILIEVDPLDLGRYPQFLYFSQFACSTTRKVE